jgi:hypothetical protein
MSKNKFYSEKVSTNTRVLMPGIISLKLFIYLYSTSVLVSFFGALLMSSSTSICVSHVLTMSITKADF